MGVRRFQKAILSLAGLLMAQTGYAEFISSRAKEAEKFVFLLLLFASLCWIWGFYSTIRYVARKKDPKPVTYAIMAVLLVMFFLVIDMLSRQPEAQITIAGIVIMPNLIFVITALRRRTKKS